MNHILRIQSVQNIPEQSTFFYKVDYQVDLKSFDGGFKFLAIHQFFKGISSSSFKIFSFIQSDPES